MESNNTNAKLMAEKPIKDYIAIISFLVAGVAFILRGLWYFYYWGYFEAFHMDKCYLSVNSDNSLYSVLLLVDV